MNGFSSYLDGGKLPFDINDFKRDSKDRGSAIEVIGSRSDDESYVPSANFYKPEPISSSSSNSSAIPGLGGGGGAGSAEYTPNPPLFSSAGSQEQYVPPLPSHLYGGNGNVGGNVGQDAQYTPAPMPPPPLPPSTGPADDFNSTWNMSMSWTPLDSSLNSSGASSSSYANQSTPHSPPHFERKGSAASAPIEYNEHLHTNPAALGAEDVDHRTLQLPPAFDFGSAKLGLSKDKSRQLVDIDHRNLISLTGSPGGAEKVGISRGLESSNNSSHLAFLLQDFAGGDVDYRIVPNPNDDSSIMAPPGNGSYAKGKTSSPLKSNASTF